MMTPAYMFEFSPLETIAIFVLLALGGWLLFTARRPGGGTAEHCLRCGYELTGLTSNRCPECGAELDADGRVVGEPSTMHWGRFALGMLFLIGPLAFALGRAFGLIR